MSNANLPDSANKRPSYIFLLHFIFAMHPEAFMMSFDEITLYEASLSQNTKRTCQIFIQNDTRDASSI